MGWFTDEALEQCRKTAMVYEDAMPLSGKSLACGLGWLGQAQRIRLDTPLIPHGLEERRAARLSEYGYGLDAPWTITALEYEHGGTYDVTQDYTRALSTRRIALCVAISSSTAPVAAAAPAPVTSDWGSLLIWPITYFDEKREWEFCPGVVIVPRSQAQRELALAANQYLALADAAERWLRLGRAQATSGVPMTAHYQPMFPELCEKLGEEHATKMIREGTLDALWVALGTFTAMGCCNVFLERDSRALFMLEGQSRTGLDPFRGRRQLAWTGRGRWVQSTRLQSAGG